MNDQTQDVIIDIIAPNDVDISFDATDVLKLDFDDSGAHFPADYEKLANKPSIEGTVLIGNRTLPQIGVGNITEQDIDKLLYG